MLIREHMRYYMEESFCEHFMPKPIKKIAISTLMMKVRQELLSNYHNLLPNKL